MTPNLHQQAARQLADYDAGTPGTLFKDDRPLSVAAACELQAAVSQLRQQRGERLIGYKVGCTSSAIQDQLGINHPVFGSLFHTERHTSRSRLRFSRYDRLAIEGELAVRLGEPIPGADSSDEQWHRAIDAAFPVVELHNFIFRSGQPNAAELIANNALHAGFVQSPGLAGDLFALREGIDLSIEINGSLVDSCEGPGPAENAIRSLRWLARELPHQGLSLRPGQTVLTGSLMQLILIEPNSHVAVRAGRLGTVEVEFDT